MSSANSSAVNNPNTTQCVTTKSVITASCAAPVYRDMPLNHGTLAELQEGFRLLTQGQKVNIVSCNAMTDVMRSYGLHITAEELKEVLKVVHQDDRTDGLEFFEFVRLMTETVSDTMDTELRSAFAAIDSGKTGLVDRKQFTEMLVTLGEQSSMEELEEMMAFAGDCEKNGKIDYNRFISELVLRINHM